MYAHDTQLYITFKQEDPTSMNMAKSHLEDCVKHIRMWMAQNMLKLNDKTEYMLIQSRHLNNPVIPPTLNVGNSIVESTHTARNLGVMFDDVACMERHVSNVVKSVMFNIREIGRIRKFLTYDATQTLINAFVTSRLDYSNALLVGLPQTVLIKLQRAQNASARVVKGCGKFDHITPVLQELHWLPIKQRIIFKVLLITFKAINGLAPEYISDMITKVDTNTRHGRSIGLHVPRSRLVTYGDRSFSHAAPKLWNKLPRDIRLCDNITRFKSKLKTFLFHQAF
jgi:hypothetical protein